MPMEHLKCSRNEKCNADICDGTWAVSLYRPQAFHSTASQKIAGSARVADREFHEPHRSFPLVFKQVSESQVIT